MFSYQYKKKSRLNDTQIKIRFYDLFHYLYMLLRCDPVYNWLNTGRLITPCHRRLVVELGSGGQFFFSWKALYDESECLKNGILEKNIQKPCINSNMISDCLYNFWYSWSKSQSKIFLNKKTYVDNLIFMISNGCPNNRWQSKEKNIVQKTNIKRKNGQRRIVFFSSNSSCIYSTF